MGNNPNDSFHRWVRDQDFTSICVKKPIRNRLNSVIDNIWVRMDGGRRISVNSYCVEHVFNKEEFLAELHQAALAKS